MIYYVVIDELDKDTVPVVFPGSDRAKVVNYLLADIMQVHTEVTVQVLDNDDVRLISSGYSMLIREANSISLS